MTKNAGISPLKYLISVLEGCYPKPYLDDQTRVSGKSWSEVKNMAMSGGSELDSFKAGCSSTDLHTLDRLIEA